MRGEQDGNRLTLISLNNQDLELRLKISIVDILLSMY